MVLTGISTKKEMHTMTRIVTACAALLFWFGADADVSAQTSAVSLEAGDYKCTELGLEKQVP